MTKTNSLLPTLEEAIAKLKKASEISIGDDFRAYNTIVDSLPESQGKIIYAMSMSSDLHQIYFSKRRKSLWDMTGPYGVIPHHASVRALIKRNIIVSTISNEEWNIQIALGTADERIWKLNKTILEPLQNAICLIRTIGEHLKAGDTFDVCM